MTIPAEREAPTEIGRDWRTIDTPALLVDLDRLDGNIGWMAEHARAGGVALRPHFKTHKSVAIARRLLDAGDSIKIHRELLHRFLNESDRDAEVLIIISPPTF